MCEYFRSNSSKSEGSGNLGHTVGDICRLSSEVSCNLYELYENKTTGNYKTRTMDVDIDLVQYCCRCMFKKTGHIEHSCIVKNVPL